jgi:hypothetical protein
MPTDLVTERAMGPKVSSSVSFFSYLSRITSPSASRIFEYLCYDLYAPRVGQATLRERY